MWMYVCCIWINQSVSQSPVGPLTHYYFIQEYIIQSNSYRLPNDIHVKMKFGIMASLTFVVCIAHSKPSDYLQSWVTTLKICQRKFQSFCENLVNIFHRASALSPFQRTELSTELTVWNAQRCQSWLVARLSSISTQCWSASVMLM